MLPIVSLQDKIGQIERFTTYLRKHFGKKPQGCWIPAFAWEQNLVSPLSSCGMTYTFLPGSRFAEAGAAESDSSFPCLCEDQGKLITVFPLSQYMETALAEKNISALLEEWKKQTKGRETILSIFPEKLAADQVEAPDYTWNRFFEELSLCEAFTETILPEKALKNLAGLKKRCFSDSVPAAEIPVNPRRFLIEHPEANGIYAKMIYTNLLINQLRGDKSRKDSARVELWKAQSCGLFYSLGRQGVYRHSLRSAAYSALINAERISRNESKFAPSLIPYDFNLDGTAEYLFQETKLNCYVQLSGGGIFELDYLPLPWNYLNSCGARVAFSDRLLPPATAVEDLNYGPVVGGRYCRNEQYAVLELDKTRQKLRLGTGQNAQLPFGGIEIEKTFSLKKDSVLVQYKMVKCSGEKENFVFSPEIDLSFPGEGDAFVRFFAGKDTPLSESFLHGADSLKIQDLKNEAQISLSSNQPFDLRIAPVRFHVADSDLYQASCIMPFFAISLEKGESWSGEFILKISH